MQDKRLGFSLLELLIYMGLLAVVMIVIVEIFVGIGTGRGKSEAQTTVNSNLRFAFQEIQNDLRAATSITTPTSPSNGNGTLGSWSNANAMPSAIYLHSAVVNNGYIYTTGGYNGNPTSTVFYAPMNSTGSIGAWQTTALPSAFNSLSAVVNNGYIYTTGGYNFINGGATSTVFYAPINSTGSIGAWSTTIPLPSTLSHHSAVVNNGYLYITGGNASGTITSTVFYAPITSTGSLGAWSTTTPLPSAIDDHSAVVNNGYIYTTGGTTGVVTSTVFYAPINSTGSIGAWATTTPLPSTIYQHSSVVYNGYIYTTGGNVGGGVVTSTVFYAPITSTGSIGAWQKTTALPSAIYGLSAVINNGYIYTTGGQTSAPTSTVFYAPINSANGSGLTLVNTGGTTISYCVVSGVLYRQAGGAACSAASSAITDNNVLVATSTFTRLENTNAILGKTVVSIQADFVMSYNATGPENQYSEEMITTVALRN